jgi:hypothetical protein
MSVRAAGLLTVASLLFAAAGTRADEAADQVAKQKKTAQANWERLELNKPAFHESKLFLIYGELPEAQLRGLAGDLERHYQIARKALRFEAMETTWPGKLTVYVFTDRRHLTSFVRLVEQRRPQEDEQGGFDARGNAPHVSAGPPTRKEDPSVQAIAGEHVASTLLARKAGTSVPDWVVTGFGRATGWRAAPTSPLGRQQRGAAARLLGPQNVRTVKDVWSGKVKDDEAMLLQASLMDYLAYGPASSHLLKFLEGFRPEQGKTEKTAEDALKTADIGLEQLNYKWKSWARRPY